MEHGGELEGEAAIAERQTIFLERQRSPAVDTAETHLRDVNAEICARLGGGVNRVTLILFG